MQRHTHIRTVCNTQRSEGRRPQRERHSTSFFLLGHLTSTHCERVRECMRVCQHRSHWSADPSQRWPIQPVWWVVKKRRLTEAEAWERPQTAGSQNVMEAGIKTTRSEINAGFYSARKQLWMGLISQDSQTFTLRIKSVSQYISVDFWQLRLYVSYIKTKKYTWLHCSCEGEQGWHT